MVARIFCLPRSALSRLLHAGQTLCPQWAADLGPLVVGKHSGRKGLPIAAKESGHQRQPSLGYPVAAKSLTTHVGQTLQQWWQPSWGGSCKNHRTFFFI